MKHKNSILTASAYIYMPVLFTILGYFLLVAALLPVYDAAVSVANLVITKETPVFSPQLTSIYVPSEKTPVADGTTIIDVNDIELPRAGSQYGNIKCDKIGLSAPLYWDDTLEILRYGAGQNISSFLPGFGRLLIIAGHNSTYFKVLQNIEVGDVIDIDTNYSPYQYEVTNVTVMDEDDLRDMFYENMPKEEETLYMYTCYPFTAHVGRRTDRFLVTCKRIAGADIKWKD
jgi:sortase A